MLPSTPKKNPKTNASLSKPAHATQYSSLYPDWSTLPIWNPENWLVSTKIPTSSLRNYPQSTIPESSPWSWKKNPRKSTLILVDWTSRSRNLGRPLCCLSLIKTNLKILESDHPKDAWCSDPQAQAKPWWPEPVQAKPKPHSWNWQVQIWSRCTSVTDPKWWEMPLPWPKRKPPQSSSLMKSTLSAPRDSTTINRETGKSREPCWSCSTISTGIGYPYEDFHPTMILKLSAQPTDLTCWTPPWWDQADWTER